MSKRVVQIEHFLGRNLILNYYDKLATMLHNYASWQLEVLNVKTHTQNNKISVSFLDYHQTMLLIVWLYWFDSRQHTMKRLNHLYISKSKLTRVVWECYQH